MLTLHNLHTHGILVNYSLISLMKRSLRRLPSLRRCCEDALLAVLQSLRISVLITFTVCCFHIYPCECRRNDWLSHQTRFPLIREVSQWTFGESQKKVNDTRESKWWLNDHFRVNQSCNCLNLFKQSVGSCTQFIIINEMESTRDMRNNIETLEFWFDGFYMLSVIRQHKGTVFLLRHSIIKNELSFIFKTA